MEHPRRVCTRADLGQSCSAGLMRYNIRPEVRKASLKSNGKLHELLSGLRDVLPEDLRQFRADAGKNFKAALGGSLEQLDLVVSRREYDIQLRVLERLRLRVEELEQRVAELEQQNDRGP